MLISNIIKLMINLIYDIILASV